MSKLTKALLLRNCPGFTDILLEELASEEKVVGLNVCGANVEAIAMKLLQADIFSHASTAFLPLNIWDFAVPPKLSSRKKEDVTQRWVEGMAIKNSLKAISHIIR